MGKRERYKETEMSYHAAPKKEESMKIRSPYQLLLYYIDENIVDINKMAQRILNSWEDSSYGEMDDVVAFRSLLKVEGYPETMTLKLTESAINEYSLRKLLGEVLL